MTLALTLLLTTAALANDGPTPGLFAEQVGPDVELTLRLHENGEPGIDYQLDLSRDGESILSDHRFSPDEAVATDWYCSGGDSVMYGTLGHAIDCDNEDEAQYCEACGDSDLMCPIRGCYESYDIVVVDACVPEGSHRWSLRGHGSTWEAADVSLDVVASDEPCAKDPDDPDTVCGCQTTSSTPGFALGLLMLAIGVLARPRR